MELIALFTVALALALRTADAQLAIDEKENCFARVDEAEWPAQQVLRFNASEAAVIFDLRRASESLRECLEDDDRAYQVRTKTLSDCLTRVKFGSKLLEPTQDMLIRITV